MQLPSEHLEPISNTRGCLADVGYAGVNVPDASLDALTNTLKNLDLCLQLMIQHIYHER